MTSEEGRIRNRILPSSAGGWVLAGLVALMDAVLIAAIPILVADRAWLLLTVTVVLIVVVSYSYLSPRARVLKWLTPGLIFLGLFMVWPIVYTAYVSLTNWATGNTLTQEQVIERLERQVIRSEEESVTLALSVYEDDEGEIAYLVTDPDRLTYFGRTRSRLAEPLEDNLINLEALGVDVSEGPPETIGPYRLLGLRDLFALGAQLENLVMDIPGRGLVQVQTTSQARLVTAGQRYIYDPDTDAIYDAQLDMTCPADVGNFICPDGRRIDPGWREVIGPDNYLRVITNPRIRAPFLGVFVWNLIFATSSVLLTFALGLALANALQHDRLRGKSLYRSLFILPYAIPGFLTIIIWRGLLSTRFGQVNSTLGVFGIDPVPWLTNGTWAKVALLVVNLWLGFPYMFLITSGALQAVPEELKEAARVDGAGPWRVFRTITLPLLLVSTAPLLIGSFAYNFNNFVLVFLLTNGGPPIVGADVPVGQTDILITFTFDLALRSGRGNQFALGAAVVIVIFVVLAVISALSFRATKRLEETYGNA